MSVAVSKTAYQLRISLKEYTPTIWRRLLIPGGTSLAKLHTIFQAAMGWDDYHLHCFEIGGVRYGVPDPEFGLTDVDDTKVRLADLVGERARFEYQYDFGDDWHHEVIIESVSNLTQVLKCAVCLDGQRSCPPEDVGGAYMYSMVLEAAIDPNHEDHDEYVNWIPPGFDPDAFDLAATNAALQRVR